MRPLPTLERFLERLFERPTARLFGTRPQPVQIQHRIARAMEHGRIAGQARTRVPDQFTVHLNPLDLRALGSETDLPVRLASAALAFARAHRYELSARPHVALVGDPSQASGEISVLAQFSKPNAPTPMVGSDPGQPEADLVRTRAFVRPPAPGPRVTLRVTEPGGRERTLVADGRALAIGRGEDNGLVLADVRASRHHARLQARDGILVLSDLGSTNGTWVNGARISEVAIGVGDGIEVGGTSIAIMAVDDGTAANGTGDR
jgi:hypothetical protein